MFSKRYHLSPPAAHHNFPQDLAERAAALQDIAAAHTQQQRAALARKLWHSTEVLNQKPDTLRDKAAALSQQLQQQQGVTADLVQSLIATQPSVLMFRPEGLVQKLAGTAQRLSVQPAVVLSMWLRQRTMAHLPLDTIEAKMLALAGTLHLQDEDLCKLVVSAPTLLASSLDVVKSRFESLLATLPNDIWTAEMLGYALLRTPAALTYRADTVRHKWQVVSRYAVLHEPSAEQLQLRQQGPAVLNVFSRSDAQIAMLEYIMLQQPLRALPQLQQAADGPAVADGSSSSSSSSEAGGTTQTVPSGKGKSKGRTLSLLVEGQSGFMPRLMCVLSPSKAKWQQVQQQYPGFAEWYQQRKEEGRKKRQPRWQEEEQEEEEQGPDQDLG